MNGLSNLDIADCIDPASPLGGAVGLESVGCHGTLKLIEVDEDERAYGNKKDKHSAPPAKRSQLMSPVSCLQSSL